MRAIAPVMVAIALVACGGDDDPSAGPTSEPASEPATPTPTSPTPTPIERWPLTGLPAPDGVGENPVLVVKVDNSPSARPQVGLSSADLIVEEPVEGGLTRLAALYHSELPDQVVPVRSIRTSDVGIVAPTGGALVASGGAQRVLRLMDDEGITVLAEGGAAGFSRNPDRPSLYSVTVDLAATVADAADLASPAIPYLEWADDDTVPTGWEEATAVDIKFSAGRTTHWEWDGDRWTQPDDLAAAGDEFTPANILVLHVTTRDAGYTDPGGNPVNEVVWDEPGGALLLTGGMAIDAEWSADGQEAGFVLTGESGEPIAVAPGRTWVGLVPESGSVQTQ
jgi:hypothetical protein